MEKNEKLQKKAPAGRIAIKGSLSTPDLGPDKPARALTSEEAIKLKGAQPMRRPFNEDEE